MFNKRESGEQDSHQQPAAAPAERPAAPTANRAPSGRSAAIGPSITIEGVLKGEEDVVVEGRIKGTVELKKNTLTVGGQGTIEAQVFAHSIDVDGTVNGDLYASERISIRKSARIKGNIVAPRVSLEDGAKFQGAIDMNTDSEAFRKAFGGKASNTASIADAARPSAGKSGPAATGSSSTPSSPARSSQPDGKSGGSAA